ncbi:ceramide transfer protein-like isoform X3 [Artemia franciscana]|uniref:ceramide transfer protein-like isoform X3 n=1 Tax=Artemia franciscana TaxID=6661 RepID=UPI0032DB3A5B
MKKRLWQLSSHHLNLKELYANGQTISMPHKFDECRFDVIINPDCVWYLRARNAEQKHQWLEVLDMQKVTYGEASNGSGLKRHGSSVSIVSASVNSVSHSQSTKIVKEKMDEMETFRDLLVKQVDSLQKFFDTCKDTFSTEKDGDAIGISGSESPNSDHKMKEQLAVAAAQAFDFRGEALTFKTTSAGVLIALQHCLDIISQREDLWRKKLEKEVEKRKKIEELYKGSELTKQRPKLTIMSGPDYEEGPHSQIGEEEFFDAVEAGLDKLDQEQLYLEKLRQNSVSEGQTKAETHRLTSEIERITMEQLQYAQSGVEDGVWTLFAEDGEMRMYKREEEIDGLAVDPLKAVHTVKGVTAREMCQHFYNPDVRFEWETTLEKMTVLERLSDAACVVLQVHKKVWPATQRDALFWSHLRKVPKDMCRDAHDAWIVCNNSTEHPNFPSNNGKFIRVGLTICLMCQTYLDSSEENGSPPTRDNLTCKITYCAVVNPGGWAPTSVLRAVYKREYPKFLKKFTQYVFEKCRDKPVCF